MKKISLAFLLCVFFYAGISAQTFTQADEKLLADACTCINKMDADRKDKLKGAQECVTNSIISNLEVIQKQSKIDFTNQEQAANYGKKIGEKLVQTCPKFHELAEGLATKELEKENSAAGKTATGTFLRVEKDGLAKIIFKEDGKEMPYIWFTNFANSEQFMGKAEMPKGKTFKITYTEIEIYVPKADGYYTVKQILSVE